MRKGYGKIKVGHAGTLDPLASGVVIVCVGKETKKIEEYMGQEKEYVAEITFGHTTPSYDLETSFDKEFPYEQVDRACLERAVQQFIGEIEQCRLLIRLFVLTGSGRTRWQPGGRGGDEEPEGDGPGD